MSAPAAAEPNRGWRELEEENERLREENERLRGDAERLKQENERLRKELEVALRSTKRQAAPFSKGEPKPDPKPPGRRAGREYGQRCGRPIPQRIDEPIRVPAPQQCLRCGGAVRLQRVEPQ
jgi:predicted phage gp36 major capsid-like protein